MIALIRIDGWSWAGRTDPEKYARLREVLPGLPEVGTSFFSTELLADLDLMLPALAEFGIEPTIKAFKNNLFVDVRQKIAHLETEQKLLRQQIAQDGLLMQIHIPNVGLYQVNEVEVLDDACTTNLQVMLNEGWHILCVCPPNGQRRPDYILGRYNKEH